MLNKISLITVALLAMAPLVQAAIDLDIEVSGVDYAGETLAIGTTVTIKLVQSAEQAFASGGIMSVDFDGAATPTVTSGAVFPRVFVLDPDSGAWGSNVGWDWSTYFGESVAVDPDAIFDWQANFMAVPTLGGATPGLGSEMGVDAFGAPPSFPYEYTLSVDFVTTVTTNVTLSGTWDNADVTGFETVNVVPEPMTMALLALGGLYLRKRKQHS